MNPFFWTMVWQFWRGQSGGDKPAPASEGHK